jgi:hypothetical protein
MAAVTATKVAGEVEEAIQESPSTPVSAYNEWDPLEVIFNESLLE